MAPGILDALKILKPQTVIRWHPAGFEPIGAGNHDRTMAGQRHRRTFASLFADERREPALGSPADPRRTAQAWHRCRADHRGKIHGEEKAATVDAFAISRWGSRGFPVARNSCVSGASCASSIRPPTPPTSRSRGRGRDLPADYSFDEMRDLPTASNAISRIRERGWPFGLANSSPRAGRSAPLSFSPGSHRSSIMASATSGGKRRNPAAGGDAPARPWQLPRFRHADDRGGALARSRRAICVWVFPAVPLDDPEEPTSGPPRGSTHAWAQVYSPGTGRIDFDPTTGRSARSAPGHRCGRPRSALRYPSQRTFHRVPVGPSPHGGAERHARHRRRSGPPPRAHNSANGQIDDRDGQGLADRTHRRSADSPSRDLIDFDALRVPVALCRFRG